MKRSQIFLRPFVRFVLLALVVATCALNMAGRRSFGQSVTDPDLPGSTNSAERDREMLKPVIKYLEERPEPGQPSIQRDTQSELQIERVCVAAQQEMQRRGIVKGLGTTVADAVHMSFSDPHFDSTTGQVEPVQFTFKDPIPDAPRTDDASSKPATSEVARFAIDQAHANCFDGTEFPSAAKCQTCHPGHYREWAVSPHAYAQISPVFNAMSSKLIELNNGTLGDFCIRCHTPVGMARKQPIAISNLDRPPAEREGVTCVVCHRVNQNWGKISGRQALVGGGLDKPVYGPFGNDILSQVLADPDKYGVMTSGPKDPRIKSREVHGQSIPFFALTTSATCATCHDVFAPNGFRLEDAFSEYKMSPAARIKQQSCQDCHMGKTPGAAKGYDFGPAAVVGNACTPSRKRTNHMMIGPDYSIVHPGIFPHNPKAVKEENTPDDDLTAGLATLREWLVFDHQSRWGTESFEKGVSEDYVFPEPWKDSKKRIRARAILDDQFELLREADVARHQLLSEGYRLGDIVFTGCDQRGLKFKVNVCNGTDGHSVPTGFDAERLVFLRVSVYDRDGTLVFVSGDLDPNGDVRDSHSAYVHNGKLPLDRQLFSLQTRFLTRNIRGGEREQVLNVPYSLDPLPYIRPETRPFTVLGRPLGARKHKQNIEVGGHRWAEYKIQPSQLTGKGPYYAKVDLVAGMVPVNLIHAISSVGFDYEMSARDVADAVVEGHVTVHSRDAVFNVDN